MTASAKERTKEIARFVSKYPEAPTKQIVDHMMEKFEGTKRHQHRAMVYRVAKVEDLPESVQPKPKKKKKVAGPGEGPPLEDAFHGHAIGGPVVKTAKRLAPQKGRVKLSHVTIKLSATKERRKRVLEIHHELEKPTTTRILKAIKEEYPEPSEPPTRAMIVQVLRAGGDEETYNANMSKLFDVAKCPTCDTSAKREDNIFKLFGFREQNKRRQSYCRSCRANKSKEKK